MKTTEAIQASMDISLHVLSTYISDLTDEDLMKRPQKDCNHLAWQLGHLIASEVNLLESVCPGKAAALPEGFAEQHSKETTDIDDPAKFCTLAEYQELFTTVRKSTVAALHELSEEDLDADAPEWIRETFPTVGHLLVLLAEHPMMHAGQFVVVRRELGKPILM